MSNSERLVGILLGARQGLRRKMHKRAPTAGFEPGGHAGPLELLSDEEISALNDLLPWHAFTADGRGRRFGDTAWHGKRSEPQVLPDPRISLFDDRFGLKDKSVLEVGCFEGLHTVALCKVAAQVIAIDSRVENVVKTLVRCAMYDCWPRAYVQDIERTPTDETRLAADVAHHVGVLYHLRDPVVHLLDIGRYIRTGLMLDTHVARPDQATSQYTAAGETWRYSKYIEGGRQDPFSGMYGHAKWLPRTELERLLAQAGFPVIEVADEREERNGLRLTVFAQRSGE